MASCGRPQLRRRVRWLQLSGLEQLERAHDAVAIVRVERARRPRRAPRQQRVQRRRTGALQLALPAIPDSLGRRGAQIELGERGTEVEPGAPDHDRPSALGEQRVDLGMRELRVLRHAEARVNREEADEAVLEPRAFAAGRGPGEQLESGVHLQGVGGDRHRSLSAAAQAFRQCDGDRRLSHRRRSEQRNHLWRGHVRSIVASVSGVRIGCGISTGSDARAAGIEAASAARTQLAGAEADLALVFASGSHLAAPEATLEGVHDALEPSQLAGCGAGGVLAEGREVEGGTAVVVWAAALGDGECEVFHVVAEPHEDAFALSGLPLLAGADAVLLMPDPFSFPAEGLLRALAHQAPAVPILGGVASARTHEGSGALFVDELVADSGAVGVRLAGVELLPCVSQGASPVGPELTVTAGEGNVIHQLAGRPALAALRDAVVKLGNEERELLDTPPLLGIVVDGDKPEYVQGDFLVRALTGADPESGSIAIGAPVRLGQVIRLHTRDAESADRDLHEALALRMAALGDDGAAGALVFSCNGRGRGMFGAPDHDAAALQDQLGGPPSAGFFAAGEIGPVGGESFLHSFTATVAIFAR
jgi:small ligand-binding sensory domain FIST